ncbi:glycosyltransferase [Methylocella sp.]|uniref:glycosyltransferase n=1 Tax=Methylocella sp. TaxID=1978226 RepID=UPI0035AE93D3
MSASRLLSSAAAFSLSPAHLLRALFRDAESPLRRRTAAAREASRARPDAAPSAEPSTDEAAPRVVIDLSDVLCHAIWHGACAGIPRVQLEIASALLRSNPRAKAFGRRNGVWTDLGPLIRAAKGDADRTFALLKEQFADVRWSFDGARLLWRRRRGALRLERSRQAPEIRPQDCLFVGGAFWIDRDVVKLCQDAAGAGAYLVVLFHDVIPLALPSFTGHDFRREYEDVLSLPAHFVVTTELNRCELKRARRRIDGFGARVASSVVPLADEFPGAARNAPAGAPPARLADLAGGDFALCVGTIEIRKNHNALLNVWEELAQERRGAPPTLVVAGRRGWKADATLRRLDALEPGGPIRFVEAPSDEELRWLYASCQFTVFPSLFEGWGLPVGESFWFGKPCAASNSASLEAVARDLVEPFSPHHEDDMKRAVTRLFDEGARAAARARVAAAPLRRWAQFAADVERVIAERRPPSEPILRPGRG